jgi:hypothetical protein
VKFWLVSTQFGFLTSRESDTGTVYAADIEPYMKVLDDFNTQIIDGRVVVRFDKVGEMCRFQRAIKERLVVEFDEKENKGYIEIYDDWRE